MVLDGKLHFEAYINNQTIILKIVPYIDISY